MIDRQSHWCRECGHETHRGECSYRISMSQYVRELPRLMSRGLAYGQPLPLCGCDGDRRRESHRVSSPSRQSLPKSIDDPRTSVSPKSGISDVKPER